MQVTYRDYDVSNYSECKPIPAENCNWYIPDNQWKKGNSKTDGTKYNQQKGLAEMYHFRFFPLLMGNETVGHNFVAVRRIPCLCDSCFEQLKKPWVKQVPFVDQEMWKRPKNCRYRT